MQKERGSEQVIPDTVQTEKDKMDIPDMKRQKARSQKEIEDIMEDLDSMSMTLAQRDMELAEEQEINEELRQQIEDKNEEIQTLRQNVHSASNVLPISKSVARKVTNKWQQVAMSTMMQRERAAIQLPLKMEQEKSKKLQAELVRTQIEYESKLQDKEQEIKLLKGPKQVIVEALKQKSRECEEAQRITEETFTTLQREHEESQKLQNEIKELRSDIKQKQLRAEKSQAQNIQKEMAQDIQESVLALAKMEQELVKRDEIIHKLQAEMEQQKSDLDDKTKDCARLKAEKKALKKKHQRILDALQYSQHTDDTTKMEGQQQPLKCILKSENKTIVTLKEIDLFQRLKAECDRLRESNKLRGNEDANEILQERDMIRRELDEIKKVLMIREKERNVLEQMMVNMRVVSILAMEMLKERNGK